MFEQLEKSIFFLFKFLRHSDEDLAPRDFAMTVL